MFNAMNLLRVLVNMNPNRTDGLTANQQVKLFITIVARQSQCCPTGPRPWSRAVMTMEHKHLHWLIEYQQISEGLRVNRMSVRVMCVVSKSVSE